MSNKPKIYASCKAGCNWETVHKSDFEASASHIRQNIGEDGKCFLVTGKEYKIFAEKNESNQFTCSIRFAYLANGVETLFAITHTNEDKYADSFVFRLLDAVATSTAITLVYEIAGVRYSETISGSSLTLANENYLYIDGATRVLRYNADATVVAKDGETPYIGDNGNWWIGETDTGVPASGSGGGGGTTVTVNGEAVETWNADTKVDKKTGTIGLYRTNGTDDSIMEYAANEPKAYTIVQRTANGIVLVGDINPNLNPYRTRQAVNLGVLETYSKYYMHKVTIQKVDTDNDFAGNIVLQILSRQPNMYTSLADMVVDTTLILPTVACWNETGDKKVALTPSITETSITWTIESSGGYTKTISTTDNEYYFNDTPKPYELPTT